MHCARTLPWPRYHKHVTDTWILCALQYDWVASDCPTCNWVASYTSHCFEVTSFLESQLVCEVCTVSLRYLVDMISGMNTLGPSIQEKQMMLLVVCDPTAPLKQNAVWIHFHTDPRSQHLPSGSCLTQGTYPPWTTPFLLVPTVLISSRLIRVTVFIPQPRVTDCHSGSGQMNTRTCTGGGGCTPSVTSQSTTELCPGTSL